MTKRFMKRASVIVSLLLALTIVNVGAVSASGMYAEKTYTLTEDFNLGISNNVVTTNDEVKLDDTTTPLSFMWIAVSTRGTIVKVDTKTGEVLGEYWTSPSGQYKNPSRTTVDKNGSVWVANRDGHSVARVCLPESGLWVDRNGNGVCDTSTGLGDIKAWTNTGGADSTGGVSTAEDECIINYVLVNSWGTRHVSVDANNDVWVSGINSRIFNKIDGVTGGIIDTKGPFGNAGGYGGLIDGNNVIWSETSGNLLRWDTAGVAYTTYPGSGYGLGIDSQGNIWNSSYGGTNIRKFSPAGVLLGSYNQGYIYAQGCVAGFDDDIWVAHSLNQGSGTGSVGHLKNNGTLVGNVTGLPSGPTGVAVDSDGYIWATCYSAGIAVKIDPNAGPIGADGVTHIGAVVDQTVNLGGYLYNYSDMTGSTLQGAPNMGTWSVVFDSAIADAKWRSVDWNDIITGDGAINVSVASSSNGVTFSSLETVTKGEDVTVPDGQYMKIIVNLTRAATGETPILSDLTVTAAPPVEVTLTNPTVEVNEGQTAINDGTWAGADSLAATPFGNVIKNEDGTWVWSFDTTDGPAQSGLITITASQGTNSAAADFTLTVNNVAPTVEDISGPISPVQIGTSANFSANFTDPGTLDTHTAQWDWGDGSASSAGTVAQGSGSGSVSDSHTYTSAGIYKVTLTVTDNDGGSGTSEFEYVVVYDPSAGFVTGGGWIDSPAGAYPADVSLTGKAVFGFVSKYQKGANVPTGVTEFQFQVADLNFHSNSYDWLVIAGDKAMYKGIGTINGEGEYAFILSAIDSSPDMFRIKIWEKTTDTLIYDNKIGAVEDADPSIPLGGGSIIIHNAK